MGQRYVEEYLGKLVTGAIRSREGEVAPGLRFYGAENIGGAAAFVLAVGAGFPSWCGRGGWPHLGVERHRLLVQANHWLRNIMRPLISLQRGLHAGNVVSVQFGNAPHFFPATA